MDERDLQAQKRYQQLVKERGPKPNFLRDAWRALVVGGVLSVMGHFLLNLFSRTEPSKIEATATTLAGMIAIGAILTGLGVYDRIAEWGAAGAAIPITGFANTVVAAAMDFKREGFIGGMGSKMFIIAGPVIVYGTVAGFLVGLVKSAVQGLFP